VAAGRRAAAARVAWLTALAAAVAVAGAYVARAVLAPFLLAAVLAYLLDPLVEFLHRRGLGRPWAILVAYALVGLLASAFVVFVLPGLVGELDRLSSLVPDLARRAEAAVRSAQDRYRRLDMPPPVRQVLDDAIRHAQGAALASIRSATAASLSLFGSLVSLALAPFLAYYILVDLPSFRQRLLGALPPGTRQRWVLLLRDLDRVAAGFVRGQLLIAASVGVLVAAAAWLIGLPFALTLGLTAGLGELVPYFGPILGALPALAVAASRSLRTLLETGGAFLVIQQLESAVLAPKIVGRTTGLHPLAVVFALLAGERYFGLPGLLLGVPAVAALRVVAHHALRAAVAARKPEEI
jgi:predicted PurR-regulated permease PerM